MKKCTCNFCLLFLILVLPAIAYTQGCSDAGFCTIPGFKPQLSDSMNTRMNSLKLGFSYGSADHAITTLGYYAEIEHRFDQLSGFNLKLTSLAQSNSEISVFGLSDIYLNGYYSPTKQSRLTLGIKFPLTNADAEWKGYPLPMDFQSSQGTIDLIAGIAYDINRIQLVTALQLPLNKNSNAFLSEFQSSDLGASKFQSTNQFKRQSDVLLRISYPVNVNRRLNISPSLLSVYHLANDSYMNDSMKRIEITGSKGFTLNGNIYIDYAVTDRSFLQLNAGSPFIVRDSRPDGLTRSFVLNLEYKFAF